MGKTFSPDPAEDLKKGIENEVLLEKKEVQIFTIDAGENSVWSEIQNDELGVFDDLTEAQRENLAGNLHKFAAKEIGYYVVEELKSQGFIQIDEAGNLLKINPKLKDATAELGKILKNNLSPDGSEMFWKRLPEGLELDFNRLREIAENTKFSNGRNLIQQALTK
jgi:hypothetical protein